MEALANASQPHAWIMGLDHGPGSWPLLDAERSDSAQHQNQKLTPSRQLPRRAADFRQMREAMPECAQPQGQ